MNICVFGGASPVAAACHLALADQVGQALATARQGVVFGGGHHGIMGAVATAALRHGALVIGVLPRVLFEREPPHPGVTDLRVVESMHERKALMYALSDGFLVLPGGFGTLDEAMEIMTWRQLALHAKPVVFIARDSFWDGLESTFNVMHADGFLSDRDRALAVFVATPEDALRVLTELAAHPA